MGLVVRTVEHTKSTHAAVLLPDHHWFAINEFELTKELVATAMMAGYHFDQFITDAAAKLTQNCEITLCAPAILHNQISVGVEFGQRIGHAVNQARQWCDLPADILTPTILAEHAARIAKVHDLKATIFDEATVKKMGMGGLAGVSAGSAQECRFVAIEYKSGHQDAPTLVLTGKGVTFDSGGISIKPANRMDEMKDDMAGAAAVISTMEAIAHLKPRVNVIGITPIAENMPSGTAIKPGDIITFYNGMTAEVKNTDAEGRLILADALSYAVKHYKPDAIINVATLTGSCAAALGPFFAGMMSNHDDLVEKLTKASKRSGDRLWRLPFHDDYKKAVRSSVADICNIGNETYKAGAITAGFFLQNFVGDTPWVHLDIAGTSFNVPDMSYYRPGATGFGVRLFIDFLMHFEE
jgi:leucyl aminopeptidase